LKHLEAGRNSWGKRRHL